MDDEAELRAVEGLDVARAGAVLRGKAGSLPWRLVDGSGVGVNPVNLWLAELDACDNSPATLRAYAYDLLSWTRFLDAVQVPWANVTRSEVRDWVRWYRCRANPQRRRGSDSHRPAPGSVNELTGKHYLDSSYARSAINRRLSALSGFYEFALESDLGPLINPVPKSRGDITRLDAHGRHFDSPSHHEKKRAPYRQKLTDRAPRALSDGLYEEVFASLRTNRDRAIVATAISSGLRASELLSMRRGLLHAADQTAEIIPKGGSGSRALVRISPAAYLWIARYLAERPVGPPDEPVWMTLRGSRRPLTYWAMRQILERSNSLLGSNVTMHDFRHTFCMRLSQDENMTIAEMQELMRHSSIASTTRYLRPSLTELIDKLDQHWSKPPLPPPVPGKGYAAEDLQVLFGRTF